MLVSPCNSRLLLNQLTHATMDPYQSYYPPISGPSPSLQAHGGHQGIAQPNHVFHRPIITGCHNGPPNRVHDYLGSHQGRDGHMASQHAEHENPTFHRDLYNPQSSMIHSSYTHSSQPYLDNQFVHELHSERPTPNPSLPAYTSQPSLMHQTREAASPVVQGSNPQSALRRKQDAITTLRPEIQPATLSQLHPELSQTALSERRGQASHPQSETINTNHLLPTLTQASTSTRAIVNTFLPNSLRGERVSSGLPSALPTPQDMMGKTSVELWMLAKKHAKKSSSLSVAIKEHFMCFYDEFDKVLAINCVNNQVTVALLHKLWYLYSIAKSLRGLHTDVQYHRGERGLRKGTNSWHRFHQSKEGRMIYRDSKSVNLSDQCLHVYHIDYSILNF